VTSKYSKIDKAYIFLTEKNKAAVTFSLNELALFVGWKAINTHISKKLNLVLTKEKKLFKVRDSFIGLSIHDFRDLCSQKNDRVEAITRRLKKSNKTISEKLLDKAIAACMSAIEIYNKPDFSYREEIFAILIVNAWELLLKAKILKDNNNDISSIYTLKQDGGIKLNRHGKALTKSLDDCMKEVSDPVLRSSLNSLILIRDNSTHFINEYPDLQSRLHTLTTGCLDNFFIATKKWFGKNYDEYNFYVLPLTFTFRSENQSNFIDELTKNLLTHLEKNGSDISKSIDSEFSYTINLKYSREKAHVHFGIATDGNGKSLTIATDNIRDIYKWDYRDLCNKLRQRYLDFKQNDKFHALKNRIIGNPKYSHKLQLDPRNPKSPAKDVYWPENIIHFFDERYIRRSSN
jgi:hypothetical protein